MFEFTCFKDNLHVYMIISVPENENVNQFCFSGTKFYVAYPKPFKDQIGVLHILLFYQ